MAAAIIERDYLPIGVSPQGQRYIDDGSRKESIFPDLIIPARNVPAISNKAHITSTAILEAVHFCIQGYLNQLEPTPVR